MIMKNVKHKQRTHKILIFTDDSPTVFRLPRQALSLSSADVRKNVHNG